MRNMKLLTIILYYHLIIKITITLSPSEENNKQQLTKKGKRKSKGNGGAVVPRCATI